MTLHTLQWSEREPPLPIGGVLGRGRASAALAHRLTETSEHKPSGLRLAVAGDALVVFGAAEELPWVDGATWLGDDQGLMCPTTLVPNLPPALLAAAVQRRQPTSGRVICTPTLSFAVAATSAVPAPERLRALTQSLIAAL